MTIPPSFNTYTGRFTDGTTGQTPADHHLRHNFFQQNPQMSPRPSNLRWSNKHDLNRDDAEDNTRKIQRTEEQLEALKLARAERKEKDDEEMYQGLKNFNGRQRGWNGERESDRQETIQCYHDTENAKIQAQVAKERAATESQRPAIPERHITTRKLREGTQQVRTGEPWAPWAPFFLSYSLAAALSSVI
jgi:hypothetical protein